jgi:hypothetical protein
VGCHRHIFLSTLDTVERAREAVNYNANAAIVELAIVDCQVPIVDGSTQTDSIESVSSGKVKLKIARPRCYSSAAWIKNLCVALSYSTIKAFGLQHVWQSSTYLCLRPADSSTLVEFHSPHPAH